MIEILFLKKYSKPVFYIALFAMCAGITTILTFNGGESFINYFIGGLFWITGRYFYAKTDKIVRAAQKPDDEWAL